MAGSPRRTFALLLAGLLTLGLATVANACPFCTMQGQTLTDEVGQASMVLYGSLQNAKLSPTGGDFGEGTTDLVIESIVKKHDILDDNKVVKTVNGTKIIQLERYIPQERNGNGKYKYLIFCDVFKGRIDPYRGVAVKADGDMAKYLSGALAVKDKQVSTRLRFFFNYLDNADVEMSNDAYKEFGNADSKDIAAMAKDVPVERIVKWLQDPKTPGFRYGLYASMLGYTGKTEHADVLRVMLEDPDKRVTSGVDGVLAGYAMLKPKEGWEYLRGVLKDRSREFTARYAALRAARFFWDSRPDVIAKKDLLEGISQLLDQDDIADLAIEDLRKWQQWDQADRVLSLRMLKSHDIPIIRRAILRYALCCPKPQATEYVKQQRAKDPQLVIDAEELLKLETNPPVIPKSDTK